MNQSLRTENIYGEEIVGTAGPQLPQYPNGNFFNLRKYEDDENRIVIDFAIRSDIEQLQPIEFDIIFSNKINRIGTNYFPVNITNETDATSLTDNDLDDFGLLLKYEVEEVHLIDNSDLPDLPGGAGNMHSKIPIKKFKEPSNNIILFFFILRFSHEDYYK